MPGYVPFDQRPAAPVAEVGGKGASLMRLVHAGLGVPPGFTLTVAFFEPWFAALRATEAWAAFAAAEPEERPARAAALKAEAHGLRLSEAQREELEDALWPFPEEALFAVRSSSPEEDLAGSSFAGGYETVLGVRTEGLEGAIGRAFASCLDARVVIYKSQHGFDPLEPRIAVVVQRQIASEVAGVGFSLNPIDNDHDQAVFSSNWGLGETVVGGLATPDTFRVSKASGEVLERRAGAKETALWLTPEGGTLERPDPRHDALTLGDVELEALREAILKIETLYGQPMDIEWAFAKGQLYLLQARPITTHLPLHPDLMSAPGERRRLYMDLTISVQGILEPLTPMTDSFFRRVLSKLSRTLLGKDIASDPATTIPFARDGRLYVNLSNVLAVASKEGVFGLFEQMDPLVIETLRELDLEAFRSADFSRADKALGALKLASGFLVTGLRAARDPGAARERVEERISRYREELAELTARAEGEGPLAPAVEGLLEGAFALIFGQLFPLLLLSRRARGAILERFREAPEELRAHLDHIDQALPGNVTVEMGLALDRLGDLLDGWPAEGEADAESLREAIEAGAAPAPFLEAWREFLDRYGHRATMELELSRPRYREAPELLLGQILRLRELPEAQKARAIHEKNAAAREAAYAALLASPEGSGWLARRGLRADIERLEELGGLRESHKFCLVLALDRVRALILRRGEALSAAGRLDGPEQVWSLALEDLDEAGEGPALDLRARASERSARYERFRALPELPRLIDSRGRIYRPPQPPAGEGELVGQAISAGRVRGRVKVLASPDEKPLLAGEILVARATDPGWTPLFVPAAAIVLEIGGILQHGALVAREYGKPCVSGIRGVTSLLRDGELVEVDGAAGVVRRLEEPSAEPTPGEAG